MTSIKIYTATPADLSPPVQSESFCVDLVLASDYRELEAKCAALAEMRAQGVDEIAELYFTLAAHEANRNIADSWRESARLARAYGAQLRQGAAK